MGDIVAIRYGTEIFNLCLMIIPMLTARTPSFRFPAYWCQQLLLHDIVFWR